MEGGNHNIITSGHSFQLKFNGTTLVFIVWIILTGISIAAIVITLVQPSHWPNFSDPHMGFETRSTKLASRGDAISNLADASRPYGFITSNPEGKRLQLLQGNMHRQRLESWQRKMFQEQDDSVSEPPKVHTHSVLISSNNTVLGPAPPYDPDFKNESNLVEVIKESFTNASGVQSDASYIKESEIGHIEDYDESEEHQANSSLSDSSDIFCGLPTWSHARLVISARDEGQNLWHLDAVRELCHLERALEPLYQDICETKRPGQCCRAWSLSNYLLLSSNKSSCDDIEKEDLENTDRLLQDCSHHFHNLELECIEEEGTCKFAPNRCTRKSIVRGLMNFVFDIGFLPPNATDTAPQELRFIQIILPIAKSTKSYDFYRLMQSQLLDQYKEIKIVAMDLGLDDYVFDKMLIHDSIWISLMVVGCLLVILLIFVRSVLMVVFGLLNIVFSLAISYWLYCEMLGADRFPFLNLMAALLLLAVGTDDLLFIAASWQDHHDLKACDKILSQAPLWFSVTATSATTAAAMFAARLSSVTSIALFSIFAGTTMVIHWVMTLFWMVPSIVFSEALAKMFNVEHVLRLPKEVGCGLRKIGKRTKGLVVFVVTKLSYICIAIILCLTVGATYAVLVQPRLRAPDSRSFALFQSSHPFERYQADFTDSFWFERHQKSSREILPLTWVWGLKPIESRDLLDPHSKPNGSRLIFDESFDITKPKAQVFLLRFCKQLKRQPFYKLVLGPLLENCFLESLINYMGRKCFDTVDKLDRKPCCETSKFPYTAKTFVVCLERAMRDLHNTPSNFFMPGIPGPKFDARRPNASAPVAIVIQYDSSREFSLSHEKMKAFYDEVEGWTERILRTAPNSMRRGFFTSDLYFFDLQNRLMTESVSSVVIGATACAIVLYLTTRNMLVTLLAAVAVYSTLVSSLAVLALLDWRLNILESLAVTMAAGLSVDFVLHYAIKYNGHLEKEQRVRQLVGKNLAPVCIASLTTLSTGLLMLTSEVLAFRQIGIFIVDLTLNSFFISTFGFLSLLYRFGPSYKTDVEFCQKLFTISDAQDDANVTSQAPLSDSNSVITGLAPLNQELHELENMSPTFLEDPTQNGLLFDTALLSAVAIAKSQENKKSSSSARASSSSCATTQPLLQDRT